MADDVSRLLESPKAERLATGFVFTEGPLWHPDGFLYFVDIRQSHLHRIMPGKPAELVRANTGEGNGTTFDLQGRLVMCEGGNRRATRWSADTWPEAKAALGWALAERGRVQRLACSIDTETPVLNRGELVAALGFLQLKEQPPEVATLRRWLDSWTGLGAILDGMVKLNFDVALTRNGDAGWRALFYPSSFIHESRAGSAWGTTPWKPVQDAAWVTLERRRAW